MTNNQKQLHYQYGYTSGSKPNPYCKHSAMQRERYYLFNAGKVDRANGWAYDEKAFL